MSDMCYDESICCNLYLSLHLKFLLVLEQTLYRIPRKSVTKNQLLSLSSFTRSNIYVIYGRSINGNAYVLSGIAGAKFPTSFMCVAANRYRYIEETEDFEGSWLCFFSLFF